MHCFQYSLLAGILLTFTLAVPTAVRPPISGIDYTVAPLLGTIYKPSYTVAIASVTSSHGSLLVTAAPAIEISHAPTHASVSGARTSSPMGQSSSKAPPPHSAVSGVDYTMAPFFGTIYDPKYEHPSSTWVNTRSNNMPTRSCSVVPVFGTVCAPEWETSTSPTSLSLVTAPLTTSSGAVYAQQAPDLLHHPDLTFNMGDDMIVEGTPTPSTTFWLTVPTVFMNATWTGAMRNTPLKTSSCYDCTSTTPRMSSRASGEPETYVIEFTTGNEVRLSTKTITTTEYMSVTYTRDNARWTAVVPVTQLPWATMPQYKQTKKPIYTNILPLDDGEGFYVMSDPPVTGHRGIPTETYIPGHDWYRRGVPEATAVPSFVHSPITSTSARPTERTTFETRRRSAKESG